jgi:hypothetical protein
LQAKRLKELIKEVQDDYVRKETRKVRWYTFGDPQNRKAA